MLALNFDSPFYGRVYTKSNPSQCFVNGNGQTQLQASGALHLYERSCIVQLTGRTLVCNSSQFSMWIPPRGEPKVRSLLCNANWIFTEQSTSNYVNEVIVQQHSVIMTDSDRTIRVLCSFEVSDQTITLGSVEQSNIPLSPNGIDVSYVSGCE